MFSNFLLAFDGTRDGREALHEATVLAKRLGAQVHLLSVVHLTPGELLAEGAMTGNMLDVEEAETRRILGRRDRAPEARRPGRRWHAVLGTQSGADLIVIGHREQSALARLWHGSVGQQVIAHAPCSVLVAVAAISER